MAGLVPFSSLPTIEDPAMFDGFTNPEILNAGYEIRIVHIAPNTQGGAKKVLKKRAFLLIFAQNARICAQFLLIFAQFCSIFSANLRV